MVQERVAQYVKDNGIKQTWIAAKMDLTDNQVSGILNGARKMSLDEFVLFCKVVGKSPNDFMDTGKEAV